MTDPVVPVNTALIGERAIVAAMGARDLAQERYVRLIRDLRDRGASQEDIGQRVGVSQAMVSNYLNGVAKPELIAIGAAMDLLHVSPRYFFDPELVDPRWTDFVGPGADADGFDWHAYVDDRDGDAWRAFARDELGALVRAGLTIEQIPAIRSAPFQGGPSVEAYRKMAGILMDRPRGTVPPGAAAAKREQRRRGGKIKLPDNG